jgi:HSP20 family protein
MSDLIQWDPVREMATMRDSMDRVFEDFFSHSPTRFEGYKSIDINMIQTEDSVIIKATIPGIKPEDINISVTGETLTIRGETKEEEELKDANYHIREMKFGSFARSILLPTRVVTEKANAEFKDGILKLTLPKAEDVKPKVITIKAK